MAALQALAEPVGNRETSPEAEARRDVAEDARTKDESKRRVNRQLEFRFHEPQGSELQQLQFRGR